MNNQICHCCTNKLIGEYIYNNNFYKCDICESDNVQYNYYCEPCYYLTYNKQNNNIFSFCNIECTQYYTNSDKIMCLQ